MVMTVDITRIMSRASDNAPYILQSAKTYGTAGVSLWIANLEAIAPVLQIVLVMLSIVAVSIRIYKDSRGIVDKSKDNKKKKKK